MNDLKSKILIVDDDVYYLTLLKAILKNIDAIVHIAETGEKALSLIEENDFALAILDIQMPDMDGFELAIRIGRLHNRDLVPIIFLTSYISDEIQMFKGYDNGAIDYLTKPVNKTIFVNKVKIFLDLDRQKRNLILSNESLERSKLELEVQQKTMELKNNEIRKSQKETEKSKRKYIKLYDFAPTGYFTINKEGRIFEINLKGAKLFGGKRPNLINSNFKEFIDPGMLSDLDNFLKRVFENKTPSGCEIKLKTSKWKSVFVYLEGAMIDEKQKCLLSMVDITDLKKTQIALKESEELYHSLLRTSPDGIIITDLEGKITEASDVAHELLGNKDTDIEKMHFMRFIPKASLREVVKICGTTTKEGLVQNLEIKLKNLDNIEFIGEISCTQIKGQNGELKAFMTDIRNISERKLLEKQIRHSERMAGIGELATGMAHEINQPLNTISLSIDNIIYSIDNKSITDTYLKAKINKVFDNITRIKNIIDHVRTFSRDQDDFVQSELDINKSINNSISMIAEQMNHKGISLEFNEISELPMLKGNTQRFEQVMLNLLINAKDALEEKKRKLGKSFKKRIDILIQKTNNQIIIEVKDNGIGIPSENIDKILLPFYTSKPPGHGTGLGLSISYGIIKELNGELEIQSEVLKGTTIRILIPIISTSQKKN